MQGSPKYSLNVADLKDLGLSLLALLAAMTLVFLLTIVAQIDFGPYSSVIVVLITGLLHAGIKWIKSNDENLSTKDLIDALPGQTDSRIAGLKTESLN